MEKPSMKLETDFEEMEYTMGPSYLYKTSLHGNSENEFAQEDGKCEQDIVDKENENDDAAADANRLALEKAKSLSFGSFVYEGKKEFGKDSGTDLLIPYHNHRLRGILEELISQHRWKESAGVLSVMLQGSFNDIYFFRNQSKYWAAMETLKQVEGVQGNKEMFKRIFKLLKSKQPAPKRAINKKLRPAVQLEIALYLISQGELNGALEASKLLVQEQKFRHDPVANMVHGMIMYQKWFDEVSENMDIRPGTITLSEDMEMDSLESSTKNHNSVKYSHPKIPRENCKEKNLITSDSYSSIGNEKKDPEGSGYHSSRKQSHRGPIHGMVQNHVEWFDEGTDEEVSSHGGGGISDRTTVLCSPDLDRILFPILLPSTHEQMKYLIKTESDHAIAFLRDALKHFQVALSSSPPLLAALVPYLQLLLANGQVKETWKEIEKLCRDSNHILPFSLRARLAESLIPKQPKLLARCYEELLCKNPASSQSIKRLVKLHKKGNYQTESLVEYIALHLDAAYGCMHIWRELACCFHGMQDKWQAEHESDQLSMEGGNYSDTKGACLMSSKKPPRMFLKTESRSNWSLRCKWWTGRHFSREQINLEQQEVGNWEHMTFKAACASHIMGPTYGYVNDIYAALERMDEKNMLSLLKSHMHRSLRLREYLCNA